MDTVELTKLIASGGITFALLYVSLTLWQAFKQQVSERITFLETRLAALESKANGKTENP